MAIWDVDNLERFLTGVRDDLLFPLWWLIVLRGLRRGEVCGLRGQDFDFVNREMRVREQTSMAGGHARVSATKSPTSVRTLALDEVTNELLLRHC